MNIVAACVYIVCRQQNYPIMLIDISDKLAVNVYILGKVLSGAPRTAVETYPRGTTRCSSRIMKVPGCPSVYRPFLTPSTRALTNCVL